MIKLFSSKAACILCKDDDEETLELYEYAIYIVLSAILHIVTIVVLGLCFNMLIESVVFYGSFILIRKFAGGYHAKTPIRCYLFSAMSNIIVLSAIKNTRIEYIFKFKITIGLIMIFSLILILVLSPISSENKILNDKEKKIYGRISKLNTIILFVAFVILWFAKIYPIGVSIGFGIVMEAIVLLLRKVQIYIYNML